MNPLAATFWSGLLKGAGEGKYGPQAKSTYDFLAAHGFLVGILLAASGAALHYANSTGTINLKTAEMVVEGLSVIVGQLGWSAHLHSAEPPTK